MIHEVIHTTLVSSNSCLMCFCLASLFSSSSHSFINNFLGFIPQFFWFTLNEVQDFKAINEVFLENSLHMPKTVHDPFQLVPGHVFAVIIELFHLFVPIPYYSQPDLCRYVSFGFFFLYGIDAKPPKDFNLATS